MRALMYPVAPASFQRGLGVILLGLVLEVSAISFAAIQIAMGTQLGLPFANLASSMAGLGILVALAGAVLLWLRPS